MPQITIGAKEQWQPYFGDLSINCFGQIPHTHTHTNTKHTRAHAQSTPKERKKKKVKDVKVKKKKKTGSQRNYGVKILYIF